MSIIKKICFSLIITVLFFILLEFSARTYHYLKYKDIGVYSYGMKTLKGAIDDLFTSTKTTDNYNYAEIEHMADEAFTKRMIKHDIKERSPLTITQWGYPVRMNNVGFRGPDILINKPTDTVRIITMGGSFVNCVGVDDEYTWEVLLQKDLDHKAIGKYEVINGGEGAANVNHILIRLIDRVIELKPDYLIFISAYNNHSSLRSEIHLSLSWRLSKFMYNVSQFYAMLRERLALKIYKDNNYFLYNYKVRVTSQEVENLLKKYKKRLEQIRIICDENQIKPIFGMQPEFIPNGLAELQNLLDDRKIAQLSNKLNKQKELSYYELEYYLQALLNRELKRFAIENKLLLFDGVSIFPEDKYPFFIDQIHLNQKGTLLFAAALYDFFVKNNLVKEK